MKIQKEDKFILALEAYLEEQKKAHKIAKKEEALEYSRLRDQDYSRCFEGQNLDWDSGAKLCIADLLYNAKRKKAKRKAHKKYIEVLDSIDMGSKKEGKTALDFIKSSLVGYGYKTSYIDGLTDSMIINLYKAYLVDKDLGFSLPMDLKLEGHVNAYLSDAGADISPDVFFQEAQHFTSRGRNNALLIDGRSKADPSDEAYRYAAIASEARHDFFKSINHSKMVANAPSGFDMLRQLDEIKTLESSNLYNHMSVTRRNRNPYSRILSLDELNSMLRYEDTVLMGEVRDIEPISSDSLKSMYEAYIAYTKSNTPESRARLISTMPSAISVASTKNLRTSVMGNEIDRMLLEKDSM